MNKIDILYQRIINIRFYLWFLIKRPTSNYYYFLCPYGIGDTLMVAMLAGAFKKNHCNKKICLVVKKTHGDIPDMFTKVDKKLICKEIPNDLDKYNTFSNGSLTAVHPSIYFEKGLLPLLGYKGITLIDLYKIILKIPMDSVLERPVINSKLILSAKHKFRSFNLKKNKTIILAPEANSSGMVNTSFWIKLSKNLKEAGWTVCTMSQNPRNYIKGTIKINFDLSEAIPFSEEAGYVISVRSGLCDLLAFSRANLKIIYPDEYSYGGKLIDQVSIVKMGFNSSTEEYIYNKNDFLTNEIMKHLPK